MLLEDLKRLYPALRDNKPDEIDPDDWNKLHNMFSRNCPELCIEKQIAGKNGEVTTKLFPDYGLPRDQVLRAWKKSGVQVAGKKI